MALLTEMEPRAVARYPRKVLLSEKEVEQEYGFTRSWLRRCRLERRGPQFVRFSSRLVRYRRGDLEEYLARCTVQTEDK